MSGQDITEDDPSIGPMYLSNPSKTIKQLENFNHTIHSYRIRLMEHSPLLQKESHDTIYENLNAINDPILISGQNKISQPFFKRKARRNLLLRTIRRFFSLLPEYTHPILENWFYPPPPIPQPSAFHHPLEPQPYQSTSFLEECALYQGHYGMAVQYTAPPPVPPPMGFTTLPPMLTPLPPMPFVQIHQEPTIKIEEEQSYDETTEQSYDETTSTTEMEEKQYSESMMYAEHADPPIPPEYLQMGPVGSSQNFSPRDRQPTN